MSRWRPARRPSTHCTCQSRIRTRTSHAATSAQSQRVAKYLALLSAATRTLRYDCTLLATQATQSRYTRTHARTQLHVPHRPPARQRNHQLSASSSREKTRRQFDSEKRDMNTLGVVHTHTHASSRAALSLRSMSHCHSQTVPYPAHAIRHTTQCSTSRHSTRRTCDHMLSLNVGIGHCASSMGALASRNPYESNDAVRAYTIMCNRM
jgi:hypothetical protein